METPVMDFCSLDKEEKIGEMLIGFLDYKQ